MKTYKDNFSNLWAYEEDGSQDHLIPNNFIQITDEEVKAIQAEKEELILPTVPLTPQQKLENAGLSVDELKQLLGIK
jgi:hypothetical protein